MSVFVLAMIVGLGGLALMALPGGKHRSHHGGHAGTGHGPLHAHGHHGLRTGRGLKTAGGGKGSSVGRAMRLIPEPRTIFSVVALFGAAGNIFQHAAGLSMGWACAGATVVAVGLEAALVAPLFRFALRFQGRPSSPLAALVLETGQAVTVFRNGKGIVQVIRDGRTVQLAARLKADQKELPVRVGDALRIEDVDVESEKVTVSVV